MDFTVTQLKKKRNLFCLKGATLTKLHIYVTLSTDEIYKGDTISITSSILVCNFNTYLGGLTEV